MDFRGRQTIFFIAILCGVMPSSTKCQVDHFKLALQWTGAYHYQCRDDGLAHFSIHGLWQEPRLPEGQRSDDPLDLTELLYTKSLTHRNSDVQIGHQQFDGVSGHITKSLTHRNSDLIH